MKNLQRIVIGCYGPKTKRNFDVSITTIVTIDKKQTIETQRIRFNSRQDAVWAIEMIGKIEAVEGWNECPIPDGTEDLWMGFKINPNPYEMLKLTKPVHLTTLKYAKHDEYESPERSKGEIANFIICMNRDFDYDMSLWLGFEDELQSDLSVGYIALCPSIVSSRKRA